MIALAAALLLFAADDATPPMTAATNGAAVESAAPTPAPMSAASNGAATEAPSPSPSPAPGTGFQEGVVQEFHTSRGWMAVEAGYAGLFGAKIAGSNVDFAGVRTSLAGGVRISGPVALEAMVATALPVSDPSDDSDATRISGARLHVVLETSDARVRARVFGGIGAEQINAPIGTSTRGTFDIGAGFSIPIAEDRFLRAEIAQTGFAGRGALIEGRLGLEFPF